MTFDLLCAAAAFFFALLGLFRGLVRQVFGVLGFAGGLVLAHLFAEPAAVEMSPALGLSPALGTIAFSIAIFFAVEVLASILGNVIRARLGHILGALDRLGGALLGLVKGLLVVWVVASLMVLLHAHLSVAERTVGPIARLDLPHSQVVAAVGQASFLGDVDAQLRAARRH